ncbi:hypothetical protein BJ742DRAFT_790598 [Cladochytrium replicatum]|nr:hypothetical protein BJ742DRAFT_790598 [Cladochytrium replicatum]
MSMMDTPGPTTSASMTPTTAGIHVPGQYLNAQRTGSQFSSTVPSSDQIPVADKHVPEHYGTPILRSRASTASAGVDLATPSGARFPSVRINPNPEIEQEREARLGRTETATTTQTFVGDQSIGADLSAAQDIKDAVMSGLGRPMTKREGKRPETDQAARVEQCEPIGLSSGMAALQEVGGVIQEKLSDMERIRTIGEHFRHIMRELQGHPEYQDTLEYFAELMADLQALTTQAETARRFGRGGRELSEHLNIMGEELKSLMSNFAGGKPLDPFLNTVAALKEHVQDDHHTRALIRDVQVFLRKSLRSHRFLSQDTYLDQATDLLERIRVMMFEETGLAEAVTSSAPQVAEATGVRPPANRGRYRQDVQRVARELNVLLGAFGQDRTTMELMERLRKLGSSMFLDRTGKSIQLKPSLFSDFTSVVIPVLIDQIKYVPIPRIEHSDSDYHFIVENVILTSKNFLPNLVEVKVKNAAVVGLQEIMPSRMQHQLTMNFFQIHADIHDIPFYYKKKSGFLRISDYGVASIMISGQGISVLTKVLVDPNDPNRTLIPRNVEAHIDNLALDIQHSQYDNLYTAMAPLLNSVIKFQIKTAIQDEILNLLSRIDAPITQYKRDLYVYGTGLREPTMGLLQTSWNRMLSSVGLGGAPAKVTGMDSKTRRMRRLERRRREREEANYQRDVRKRMEEARRRRGSGQMDRELEEEEERVGRSAFARPAEKEAAVHPADRFLDDTKPAWMSDAFSMHALKH